MFFDSKIAVSVCPNSVCNTSLSNRVEMVLGPYLFGQREMEDLLTTIAIAMVIPLVFIRCLLVLSVTMVLVLITRRAVPLHWQ